ncbi:glycosyltransferase family 4 protein [Mucisphaera calidilacus]|uniref:glycosyltransferase family 4 protein n=1 Tax=Mucisphaera calidilacus TaxID=2527982 RepID=UPI001F377277|nr:glycosyltransferase family 4 protein [Mucisphaera calidilacus]
MPAYRIPVFRALASRPGIELLVSYTHDPKLPNLEPDGFEAVPSRLSSVGVGSRSMMWDPAQVKYASRRHADVLVLTWNAHYASLPAGLVRARLAGVRTILWGHGYSKSETGWRARVRSFLGRRADGLMFYSRSVAEGYAERGFRRDRLFAAPNALDQGPIQSARSSWLSRADDLASFRRERGLGEGPVALFVSRFAPENREALLIRATPAIAERFPGFRAVLIGKGDGADELRALAAELGVADRVIMPGAVYGEEALSPWFLSSDVFVYPANVGLSLIHAMGYGLPVVVGDDVASHNPEIVALDPGVNGLMFRHGDAGDLAATLVGLFSDRERLGAMSRSAHATVTERFTLERMVDGFEAAIRGVAGD